MFETLDKIFGWAGASLTKEKAEEIFEEYVEKGKLKREQKAVLSKRSWIRPPRADPIWKDHL